MVHPVYIYIYIKDKNKHFYIINIYIFYYIYIYIYIIIYIYYIINIYILYIYIYREIFETPKKKWSRQANPRYIGDCTDFRTPRRAVRNWKIAMSYINLQRKKIVMAQKKNCLKKKIINLETMIAILKSKKLVSDDTAQILSVSKITSN